MPQATEPLKEEAGGSSGISGFFSNLFGSDDDYERHGRTWNEAVRHGHPVIVVDATDERQAQEAVSCLQGLGAMDIDKNASEWHTQGRAGAASDVGKARDTSPSTRKDGVLDVVQEELNVGKRTVSHGGVRVIQRVSSKPVREVLRLREERAVVERRPVNRQANASDLNAFKEGTMEVRESAEEAVVSKSARVQLLFMVVLWNKRGLGFTAFRRQGRTAGVSTAMPSARWARCNSSSTISTPCAARGSARTPVMQLRMRRESDPMPCHSSR